MRQHNPILRGVIGTINRSHLLNDEEKPRFRLSDDQVWLQIIQLTKVTSVTAFQLLDKDQMREALRELRLQGASVRQLERLTGISRGIIQSIKF